MAYIGNDPTTMERGVFELNSNGDLQPIDRYWPINDPNFELSEDGQDIMLRVSNYFKHAYETNGLTDAQVEDLTIYG